jgi:hypothetical protein
MAVAAYNRLVSTSRGQTVQVAPHAVQRKRRTATTRTCALSSHSRGPSTCL